jgi:capsular exopolysaccharide synthesis family protein
LVGILLGIATAFGLDLIDRSVKTVKEAKELFGYTLIGVIPALGKSGKTSRQGSLEQTVPKVFARDLPHSPINEAYQMLQANLKFLSSDKELKAIVVTSSVPREGKSEVSANLAAAMVQVGRRVLLVDADMRHPSQHHIWELTNSVGLSNILVGEAELNAALQEVMPGLDVLTAGVIPPNPVALLDSKRMASLIETFSKKYDFVIVDTPPLAGIADAPILGKMADGILLVVRPRVVDSANAKAAKEFLARSGQNVLGLVANGVSIKNEPDSYFYYTKEQYKEQDLENQEQSKFDSVAKSKRS